MIDTATYFFAVIGIVTIIGAIAVFIYLALTDWR